MLEKLFIKNGFELGFLKNDILVFFWYGVICYVEVECSYIIIKLKINVCDLVFVWGREK